MPNLQEFPFQDLFEIVKGRIKSIRHLEWFRDVQRRMNERTEAVEGTTDEITVVDDGLGAFTVSLPDSIKLDGATASRILATGASKKTVSVATLASWISGVSGETNVADDGSGGVIIGIVNPLAVSKGGTGVATLTDGGLLLGSGAAAITALAAATNGQLPIGSTGADPVPNEIDGTTNQITITNGAGTITISIPSAAVITFANGGLHILDTNASHDLIITPGSDLTADRVLTLTTGDAARTITLSGNPTLADWFDQAVKTASQPTFAGALFTDDVTLPKTSGKGIKVEVASPTFPWRDILGDVFARNTGATKPSFTTYRDGLLDYQFAAADEEYFKFHIPHDHVPGSDIHLHIHWSHIGTLVTDGTVTFGYEMSYAKGHNQAAFPASVSGSIIGTASTTQYQHILSEGQVSASSPSGSQIDSDDLEPDGVIILRLELTTNAITVSGGGVPDPFIHYADIHYQSTNIGTKQKAPNFYV